MKAVDRYSERAVFYARFRWDYAAEAVQSVVKECGLSENSIIADIGSGTGMLTRHFAARVRTVFAVEPNPEMRAIANDALHAYRSYQSINGFSDATTLPDNSADMIAVGRALHWFPPDSTRAEFCRILKPDGWMAVFSVPCTDQAFLNSMKALRVEDNGWDTAAEEQRLKQAPLSFYFGHNSFRKVIFPGLVKETWEAFLYRICSLSPAPAADHPLRLKFERTLREVFEQHAEDGVLTIANATEAVFGRVHRNLREGPGT